MNSELVCARSRGSQASSLLAGMITIIPPEGSTMKSMREKIISLSVNPLVKPAQRNQRLQQTQPLGTSRSVFHNHTDINY